LDVGLVDRLCDLGAIHVLAVLDGAAPPGLGRAVAAHPVHEFARSEAPWWPLLLDLRGGGPLMC